MNGQKDAPLDPISAAVSQLKVLADAGKLHGCFEQIPEEVYHHKNCPGLSSSGLVTIGTKSMGHYIADKENPKEPSKPMKFGTAFHAALLEPDKFRKTYITEPEGISVPEYINRRTNEGKAQFKKWQDTVEAPFLKAREQFLKGKIIIDQEDFTKIDTMVRMAKQNTTLAKIMEGALYEVSFFWVHPETGILIKCRTDIINMEKRIVVDVKTALDASPDGFGRACVNLNYDVKAEFYLQILEGLYGGNWHYLFYAAEKETPFAPMLHVFHEALRDNAKYGVENWLSKVKATKENKAPYLYPQHPVPLNIPHFGWDTEKRFGEKYEYE